jgi:type VI secretion system protein ImpK
MAEEPKQAFDPDATVSQPGVGGDPDATVSQPIPVLDPEATVNGPLAKKPEPDPDATDRRPAFDPEATFNPADKASLDPEATVRIPSPGRVRNNPFAPKAPPETITANLAALGGLNPLVAMANPILAAVPQIRRTLKHADAPGLLANLSAQVQALEMTAITAGISDDAVGSAVYALCALLDESAAATPWGGSWIENGLLQQLRGESGGAEGFFAQLEQVSAAPEQNADLLEFFYVCLALGFEGRYRGMDGGRQALAEVKEKLYGLITQRRPRPEGLSERWRTPAAQAAADAALATAARANAARAAADAAAHAPAQAPAAPGRFDLSHWPRRAIWSAVAGIVGASIVLYMLALRLLDDETKSALSAKPSYRVKTADGGKGAAAAPAPASDSAAVVLARSLEGVPVVVAESAGGVSISIRHDRQFAAGSPLPAADVQAMLGKIAKALDKQPGAITVVGHADASPPGARYTSNADLSAARARAAAKVMAAALADPKRVASAGRGDAEPIAPNDTDANRAKNRRIVILFKPGA